MNKMRQEALNELHKPKEIQSKNQIFEQVKAERKFLMEQHFQEQRKLQKPAIKT